VPPYAGRVQGAAYRRLFKSALPLKKTIPNTTRTTTMSQALTLHDLPGVASDQTNCPLSPGEGQAPKKDIGTS
jgi:hypothetical protein